MPYGTHALGRPSPEARPLRRLGPPVSGLSRDLVPCIIPVRALCGDRGMQDAGFSAVDGLQPEHTHIEGNLSETLDSKFQC